jgi:3-methylfumaryl-CoA hydratase
MATSDQIPFADHTARIGRTEDRKGMLTCELAGMLNPAVAHDQSTVQDLRLYAAMPPLWHWAAFPDFVPLRDLGVDGHPALGGFMPRLRFQRRMWAGDALRIDGVLQIGERLQKRPEIVEIPQKSGAAGPMVFVSVTHRTLGDGGGGVEEQQGIVYLDNPDRFIAPRKVPVFDDRLFDETVPMNEARLSRYSAATFNTHRIHYDLPHARRVEKYPALIVHGPMQATMLIEAARRHAARQVRSFTYRGVHPMFHGHDLRLVARRDPDAAALDLATATPDGYLGMQARIGWA